MQVHMVRGPIGCWQIALGLIFEIFAVIPISILGLFGYVVPGILAFMFGTGFVVWFIIASSGKVMVSPDERWIWNGYQWIPRR